jgi:hypothetical protein
MRRRVLFGIGGWLAAVVAATGVGIAAIGVLEDGITGSRAQTLDRDGVRRALSGSAVPSAPPTGTVTPAPRGGEVTRVLYTEGGKVTASCSGDQVTLLAWIPAQSYGTDDVERGPAPEAFVKFESDDEEYEVTLSCEGGQPVQHTRKDDHGGRGRGRGHGD